MIDEILENDKKSEYIYDVEEYKKKKKEQVKLAYKMIDEAIDELKGNPKAFKSYLDMQCKFDYYSPKNVLLINKQNPNASLLKTKKEWKEKGFLIRNPKPKVITLLEPREPYEIGDRTIISYNAKDMVDASEVIPQFRFADYDKKILLQSLLHECPIPIEVVDSLESGKVCECNTDDKVLYVTRSEINDEYFKALAREITKISLYENSQEIDEDKAECICYMLCKRFGINVSNEKLESLSNKFSNTAKQDIINDLVSMKEVLHLLVGNMINYYKQNELKNNIKVGNKEHER